MDEETQEELRKRKLFYGCKEPYNKDHDFPLIRKGKMNYFMWADFEDSDSDQQVASKLDQGEKTSAPMEYIANVQDETTFRFRGTTLHRYA